jgi:hypothetical protein
MAKNHEMSPSDLTPDEKAEALAFYAATRQGKLSNAPLLVSIRTAGFLLNVSPATLRRHCAVGTLRSVPVGRCLKLSIADVAAISQRGLPVVRGIDKLPEGE